MGSVAPRPNSLWFTNEHGDEIQIIETFADSHGTIMEQRWIPKSHLGPITRAPDGILEARYQERIHPQGKKP